MFTSATISEQLAACANDSLRVLVIGAGIAGTTAAQLLRRRGLHPVLIDRATGLDDAGYMLALMPMVDRALDELGVREKYRSRSTHIDVYRMLSRRGAILREDRLGDVLDMYGDYRGISRGALLDVLTDTGAPVSRGTTVNSLEEGAESIQVRISSPDSEIETVFDLVIIADGIHSHTRELVSGEQKPDSVVTGWGGWVVWTAEESEPHLGEELWGDGFFVGSYPVAGEVGVFIGGAQEDTTVGPKAFVTRIRSQLKTGTSRLQRALTAVEHARDPFYWVLDDVRTTRWAYGRTILLGDAAAGFLPTAGIGAGMAMESAWVLCRALAGTTPKDVASGLTRYEAVQKPRVESAQSNSRQLAGLMFRRGSVLALLRDTAMRVTSVKMALRPIIRLLQQPPEHDRVGPKPPESLP